MTRGPVIVLIALALAGAAAGAWLVRTRVPAGRAEVVGRIAKIDEGVETRMLVRRIPLVPCPPPDPREDGTQTGCTADVAIEIGSGGRALISEIRLEARLEPLRERIATGNLVAIGTVARRARLDALEERPPRDGGPDGGARVEGEGKELVLLVRDTAPPTPADIGRAPLALYALRCPGFSIRGPMLGDATHLYFAGCEALRRVRKDGTSVAADKLGTGTQAFAIDDDAIYAIDTELRRTPKAGGPTETIAGPCKGSRALVVDDAHVYCTSSANETHSVQRIPKRGGAAAVIATTDASIFDLALSPNAVIYTSTKFSPKPDQRIVAVDKRSLEARVLVETGDAELFANPTALVARRGRVYFANGCVGCSLASVNEGGGRLLEHASVGPVVVGAVVQAIAAVDDILYAASSDGQIMRVTADAVQLTVPAAPRGATGGALMTDAVHADAEAIYYVPLIDEPSGTRIVLRQPR